MNRWKACNHCSARKGRGGSIGPVISAHIGYEKDGDAMKDPFKGYTYERECEGEQDRVGAAVK